MNQCKNSIYRFEDTEKELPQWAQDMGIHRRVPLSKDIEDVKFDMGFARSLVFTTNVRTDVKPCSVMVENGENMKFLVLCRPSAHDLRLLSEWARQSAEYMEASE